MDRRLTLSIAVSVPLAAGGALALLLARDPPAQPPASIVEHCQRAAELLYDISWAAACRKTADDSTDCMLPDAEAARVNAILGAEESRCLAAEAPSWTGH